MSMSEVRERLAEQFEQISGVNTAHRRVPRTLQRAELPSVVIHASRASYDLRAYGEQIVRDDRIYEAVLYVAETGDGTEGDGEEACEPFIDRVRDYFLARTGMELNGADAFVEDIAIIGDGGVTTRPYPQGGTTLYYAIPFQFRVWELHQVNYEG